MLPMPHSLFQGSSGFLMRSLSRYVMTDPPGYTRFLQNQRRLSTPVAATEGLPQSRCILMFRNSGAQPVHGRHTQPVHGRHKCSYDVQVRSLIFQFDSDGTLVIEESGRYDGRSLSPFPPRQKLIQRQRKRIPSRFRRNCLEDRLQDSLFRSTEHAVIVMPSGRQIFALTIGPKIPGAVIPARVFT
jgi:hypothetical protein